MVGDHTNVVMYEKFKKCKESWEKYGYSITPYKPLRLNEYDFWNEFNTKININSLQREDLILYVSIVALFKKLRKSKKPAIVINYDQFLYNDIPRNMESKQFFNLSYNKRQDTAMYRSRMAKMNGFYIHPRPCHILYDRIMSSSHIENLYDLIYRTAIEEKWLTHEEAKFNGYTIKYTL